MSNYDSGNDSILEMYIFESETLLDQLEEILLQSEDNAELTPDDINEIFRIMHTIKGSSAMMEFDMLAHSAHKLEDLFFVIRENGIKQEDFGDLMDLVLNFSTFLKGEVEKIQNNETLQDENEELISETDAFLNRIKGLPQEKPKEGVDPTSDEDETKSEVIEKAEPEISFDDISLAEAKSDEIIAEVSSDLTNQSDEQPKTYCIHTRFKEDSQMENIRAFMLVNKLESIGKVSKKKPEQLNNNPEAAGIILKNGFYCHLETTANKETIENIAMSILSVKSIEFVDCLQAEESETEVVEQPEVVTVAKKAPEKVPDPNANKQKNNVQNLISVDLNKLDTLMNLIGEIVITESMVFGSVGMEGERDESFEKASTQLQKLTDELQDIVMSIRMIPIAGTFKKMQRIVRDVGKKLKKEVEFITMGESTEVDKTIIDGIADPLMHLVRNAMDHGLENKEERIAAGKNPVGKVILSAQNVGGDIIISVSDDGKGLDPAGILEKAKEKKLLIKPEEEYSEKEILNLIMAPGFSTKEVVTEFSGRGVGMDVVKKNIEKVGGSISIESEIGSGTNIFLKIPLTLSIISGMEVLVGEDIYEIPISNIRETFKITTSQLITDPDKNEMVMIRGVCYPLIRLHDIFEDEKCETNIEDGILMLVDSGDTFACLFMDDLIKKHQIVVKPIPKYLNRYSIQNAGIAGCTILGNGSISLIVDIPAILDKY
ncbi:chemotaxis protein CheA [Acetobacterium woodii]|uniref:Chemotaxis protein CheA n=1 Tax=Acetobacterium woodii (strain ATCC 29683 / DSM 1030 / JCM 2381 / KCTC 1655 / WB1) TaxID=931626 RepID=H6LDR2_ACEWD|nr:chemotaxis protein CheA [Acetobacterium woodii]AFA49226.1 chemotaxis protein histidin kinase CheA4 [Acetobacterium woodii DSM 1030]